MNGQIGTLYQDGKQVGGFLEWSLDIRLFRTEKPDSTVYTVHAIKCTADKFWVLSAPSDSEIVAYFYQLIKGRLVLMAQRTVEVNLAGPLNKTINRPLEITWMN